MSNIIKKIEASATGKRQVPDWSTSLLSVQYDAQKPASNPYLTEYFLGVKLGHTVKVDDEIPDQKENAFRMMEHSISELIFGEFRPMLRKLSYQLYDRQFDEARITVDEIEQRMFYDGK